MPRRQRQRLAAGARAQIEHLQARAGAAEQGCHLRALVLHLEPALAVRASPPRRAGARPAPSGAGMRTPTGDSGVGSAPKRASAFTTFSRVAFSVLTRRSTGARWLKPAPSAAARAAEGALERRQQPVGNVAVDVRGRVGGQRGGERSPSPPAIKGAMRVLGAVGRRRHLVGRHGEGARRRAERQRARGVGAHPRRDRALPPQRVVDERADRRPVAGAREAVRLAPVGERGRRRAVALENVLEDVGGGLQPGTRAHEL